MDSEFPVPKGADKDQRQKGQNQSGSLIRKAKASTPAKTRNIGRNDFISIAPPAPTRRDN